MKKIKRSYTVFFGGEIFSLKHLTGNAALAEAIYERSHGRFRCVLPQDFTELRGRSGRMIRDHNLRALAACDLALFNFDGVDLDSGTVVEFMFAKFADIPALLVRTDIRGAGDHRAAPWNVMATYLPRTVAIVVPSLPGYRGAVPGSRARLDHALHLAGQHASAAAQRVCDQIAARCVRGFERLVGMAPVLPKSLRDDAYRWLPLAVGLSGREELCRREFARMLRRKIERDLL